MVERTKGREEPGMVRRVLDEGISTEIWILDSMDRRPSRRGGIWTRRRQSGVERGCRGKGMERGCGRKFQWKDKGASEID